MLRVPRYLNLALPTLICVIFYSLTCKELSSSSQLLLSSSSFSVRVGVTALVYTMEQKLQEDDEHLKSFVTCLQNKVCKSLEIDM